MDKQKNINESVHFERKDVNAAWLGAIGAAIVIAAIILPFILWGIYRAFQKSAERGGAIIPETQSRQQFNVPPEPRLETNPISDYRKFRADEDEKLNNYGWADRQKGIVHIPIKQAMQLLAARGLPAVKQQPSSAVQAADQSQTIGGANQTRGNLTANTAVKNASPENNQRRQN